MKGRNCERVEERVKSYEERADREERDEVEVRERRAAVLVFGSRVARVQGARVALREVVGAREHYGLPGLAGGRPAVIRMRSSSARSYKC